MLMSYGMQRNKAVERAWFYCRNHIPYVQAWQHETKVNVKVYANVDKFIRAMNLISESLQTMCAPSYACTQSFSQIFNEHMSVLKKENEALLGRAITISSGSTKSMMDAYEDELREILSGAKSANNDSAQSWRKNL